ncbi:MAG: HD domain-containing protein [Actinomycetota bacterium]|nr:HD domain-containing protein [Actinomycetota bacterium]
MIRDGPGPTGARPVRNSWAGRMLPLGFDPVLATCNGRALAAEYRDDDTGQHTRRVGRMAALLAQELGLEIELVERLERAAGLHDVGKIGVPDSILLAPRKLTPEEFEVVKTHTVIGARIMSGSRSPLMIMSEEVAWSHHERWDGRGYGGVAGEDIPLVAVADVFDALTHERPYKEAWPLDEAIAEIRRQRGQQFDPRVVDAFVAIEDEIAARPWVSGFRSPHLLRGLRSPTWRHGMKEARNVRSRGP